MIRVHLLAIQPGGRQSNSNQRLKYSLASQIGLLIEARPLGVSLVYNVVRPFYTIPEQATQISPKF